MNTTNSLVLKCFDLQNELNTNTFNKTKGVNSKGTWITSDFNYGLAALEELGEATKELGYHWWKKSEFNKQKFYSELVDVFHFALSIAIQDRHYASAKDEYDSEYIKNYFLKDRNFRDEFNSIKLPIDKSIELLCQNLFNYGVLHYLFSVCLSAGLSIDNLCIMYIGKNALNQFRLNNGYSEGNYQYKAIDNFTLDSILLENINAYLMSDIDELKTIIYKDLSEKLLKCS